MSQLSLLERLANLEAAESSWLAWARSYARTVAVLMALRETPLKIRVTVEKDYKEDKRGEPELPFT